MEGLPRHVGGRKPGTRLADPSTMLANDEKVNNFLARAAMRNVGSHGGSESEQSGWDTDNPEVTNSARLLHPFSPQTPDRFSGSSSVSSVPTNGGNDSLASVLSESPSRRPGSPLLHSGGSFSVANRHSGPASSAAMFGTPPPGGPKTTGGGEGESSADEVGHRTPPSSSTPLPPPHEKDASSSTKVRHSSTLTRIGALNVTPRDTPGGGAGGGGEGGSEVVGRFGGGGGRSSGVMDSLDFAALADESPRKQTSFPGAKALFAEADAPPSGGALATTSDAALALTTSPARTRAAVAAPEARRDAAAVAGGNPRQSRSRSKSSSKQTISSGSSTFTRTSGDRSGGQRSSNGGDSVVGSTSGGGGGDGEGGGASDLDGGPNPKAKRERSPRRHRSSSAAPPAETQKSPAQAPDDDDDDDDDPTPRPSPSSNYDPLACLEPASTTGEAEQITSKPGNGDCSKNQTKLQTTPLSPLLSKGSSQRTPRTVNPEGSFATEQSGKQPAQPQEEKKEEEEEQKKEKEGAGGGDSRGRDDGGGSFASEHAGNKTKTKTAKNKQKTKTKKKQHDAAGGGDGDGKTKGAAKEEERAPKIDFDPTALTGPSRFYSSSQPRQPSASPPRPNLDHNHQHRDDQEQEREPCLAYKVDVTAPSFGQCVCGRSKQDHALSSFGGGGSVGRGTSSLSASRGQAGRSWSRPQEEVKEVKAAHAPSLVETKAAEVAAPSPRPAPASPHPSSFDETKTAEVAAVSSPRPAPASPHPSSFVETKAAEVVAAPSPRPAPASPHPSSFVETVNRNFVGSSSKGNGNSGGTGGGSGVGDASSPQAFLTTNGIDDDVVNFSSVVDGDDDDDDDDGGDTPAAVGAASPASSAVSLAFNGAPRSFQPRDGCGACSGGVGAGAGGGSDTARSLDHQRKPQHSEGTHAASGSSGVVGGGGSLSARLASSRRQSPPLSLSGDGGKPPPLLSSESSAVVGRPRSGSADIGNTGSTGTTTSTSVKGVGGARGATSLSSAALSSSSSSSFVQRPKPGARMFQKPSQLPPLPSTQSSGAPGETFPPARSATAVEETTPKSSKSGSSSSSSSSRSSKALVPAAAERAWRQRKQDGRGGGGDAFSQGPGVVSGCGQGGGLVAGLWSLVHDVDLEAVPLSRQQREALKRTHTKAPMSSPLLSSSPTTGALVMLASSDRSNRSVGGGEEGSILVASASPSGNSGGGQGEDEEGRVGLDIGLGLLGRGGDNLGSSPFSRSAAVQEVLQLQNASSTAFAKQAPAVAAERDGVASSNAAASASALTSALAAAQAEVDLEEVPSRGVGGPLTAAERRWLVRPLLGAAAAGDAAAGDAAAGNEKAATSARQGRGGRGGPVTCVLRRRPLAASAAAAALGGLGCELLLFLLATGGESEDEDEDEGGGARFNGSVHGTGNSTTSSPLSPVNANLSDENSQARRLRDGEKGGGGRGDGAGGGGAFVLGARPGTGASMSSDPSKPCVVGRHELLVYLGSGTLSDGVTPAHPIAALTPQPSGNGWSFRYLGESGGECGAMLLSPASMAAGSSGGGSGGGGDDLMARSGALAVPLFTAPPNTAADAAPPSVAASGGAESSTTMAAAATARRRRRFVVWRDDDLGIAVTGGGGSGSGGSGGGFKQVGLRHHSNAFGAVVGRSKTRKRRGLESAEMLSCLARGDDLDAMALFRSAVPLWTNSAANSSNDATPPWGEGVTATSGDLLSGGRFELPSRSVGGVAVNPAKTQASRKTLQLILTRDCAATATAAAAAASAVSGVDMDSGVGDGAYGGGGSGGGGGDECVLQVSKVRGEKDAFFVQFASPLSPLQAFAAACVAVATPAKGAPVALAGAPCAAAVAAAGGGSSNKHRKVHVDPTLPLQLLQSLPLQSLSMSPPSFSSSAPAMIPGGGSGDGRGGGGVAQSREASLVREEGEERRQRRVPLGSSPDRESPRRGASMSARAKHAFGTLVSPSKTAVSEALHATSKAVAGALDFITDLPPNYPPHHFGGYPEDGNDSGSDGGGVGGDTVQPNDGEEEEGEGSRIMNKGPDSNRLQTMERNASETAASVSFEDGAFHDIDFGDGDFDDGDDPEADRSALAVVEAQEERSQLDERRGEKDDERLRREGRWHGFTHLSRGGLKHEFAQFHLQDEGVLGSLVYAGIAMVAELYPSGPTYQLSLALSLLYLHSYDDVSPVVAHQSKNRKAQKAALLAHKQLTHGEGFASLEQFSNNDELGGGGGGLEMVSTTPTNKKEKKATPKNTKKNGGKDAGSGDDHGSDGGGSSMVLWNSEGVAVFILAPQFTGPKSNMCFKLGSEGMGYYHDSKAPAVSDDGNTTGNSASALTTTSSPLHPLVPPCPSASDGGGGDGGGLVVAAAGGGGAPASPPLYPASTPALSYGGVLLHSPNGALWWALVGVVVVCGAGDLDFLFTATSGRSRPGLDASLGDDTAAVVALRDLCVALTAVMLLLKVFLLFGATKRHARGRRVVRRLSHQLKYFLPLSLTSATAGGSGGTKGRGTHVAGGSSLLVSLKTGRKKSKAKLALDAEGRLVALSWLHGVCAPMLLGLAVASQAAFPPSESTAFSAGAEGNLPLTSLLFVKAVTVFLVFGALFLETKPSQCLSRFGCLLCVCEPKHPTLLKTEHARKQQAALPLAAHTLRNLVVAKGVDLVVSVAVWASLAQQAGAAYGSEDAGVVAVYRLALGISCVVDGLGAVLSVVAAYLLAHVLTVGEQQQGRRGEGDDSDSDDSSESDSDVSDTDSDASSSSSSESGSSDDSSSDGDDGGSDSSNDSDGGGGSEKKGGEWTPKKKKPANQTPNRGSFFFGRGNVPKSSSSQKTKNKKGGSKKRYSRDDPRSPLSEGSSDDDDDDDEDEESGGRHGRGSKKKEKKKEDRAGMQEAIPVPDLEDGYDDYIYSFGDQDSDLDDENENNFGSRGVKKVNDGAEKGHNISKQVGTRQQQTRPPSLSNSGSMAWADPGFAAAQQDQELEQTRRLQYQQQEHMRQVCLLQQQQQQQAALMAMAYSSAPPAAGSFVPPPPPLLPGMVSMPPHLPSFVASPTGGGGMLSSQQQGQGGGGEYWPGYEQSPRGTYYETAQGGAEAAAGQGGGGYYDDGGNWVSDDGSQAWAEEQTGGGGGSGGYYDHAGNWVAEEASWVAGGREGGEDWEGGYYDDSGAWVSPPSPSSSEVSPLSFTSSSSSLLQNSNGGGGGVAGVGSLTARDQVRSQSILAGAKPNPAATATAASAAASSGGDGAAAGRGGVSAEGDDGTPLTARDRVRSQRGKYAAAMLEATPPPPASSQQPTSSRPTSASSSSSAVSARDAVRSARLGRTTPPPPTSSSGGGGGGSNEISSTADNSVTNGNEGSGGAPDDKLSPDVVMSSVQYQNQKKLPQGGGQASPAAEPKGGADAAVARHAGADKDGEDDDEVTSDGSGSGSGKSATPLTMAAEMEAEAKATTAAPSKQETDSEDLKRQDGNATPLSSSSFADSLAAVLPPPAASLTLHQFFSLWRGPGSPLADEEAARVSGGVVRTLSTALDTGPASNAVTAESVTAHLTQHGFRVAQADSSAVEGGGGGGGGGADGSAPLTVYAYARKGKTDGDADSSSGGEDVTFLLEMVFTRDTKEDKETASGGGMDHLTMTVKCTVAGAMTSFLKNLKLKKMCKGAAA